MKKTITFIILLILCGHIWSQTPVEYQLEPFNITHHEIKITATFKDLNRDTLEIRMPVASPGRYAVHHFAKNLYNEQAKDESGNALNMTRTSISSWKIAVPENGEVIFEYTLFGNYADGTYTGIDAEKMHMNMPATFAYGTNLEDRPIRLNIDLQDHPNWKIATQLPETGKNTFEAPNYYYFYDSPTMVGEIDFTSWKEGDQTIEVAMIHDGNEQEFLKYAEWIKSIVKQQKAIFGELPTYDYGKYTFLCSYNPWVHGDAMEHRNSTICTRQGNLAQHAQYMIGSIAHEYFHSWNMERIRAQAIEPFDFDDANMSDELWFGEGFTNYYDELSQCRAGIVNQQAYLENASGVLNRVLLSPGREIRNPMQMSQNAPFVDAARAVDETNYPNVFISYYTYGELLGQILDLSIRAKFENLSLDDYMTYVWQHHGKPEIPYQTSDLENALATVTGDKEFAQNFFQNYIYNSKLPDFNTLYEPFGIDVSLANPGKIYVGSPNVSEEGEVRGSVLKGTALYEAGLDKGDRIYSIDGMELTKEKSFDQIIENLEPEKTYEISFEQMGKMKTGTFKASQDPSIKLSWERKPGKSQEKKKENWLGSK